jgi:hypothetical protein
MEALIEKLYSVEDSYFAFVAGVVAYAKESPVHLQKILDYMDDTPDALSSDILQFVMTQPDFIPASVDERIV